MFIHSYYIKIKVVKLIIIINNKYLTNMSLQMFCNKRLIDYFLIVELRDIDFTKILSSKDFANLPSINTDGAYVSYNRQITLKIPKVNYNEYPFEGNGVISFFPQDNVFFSKQQNTFFTIWYTNTSGAYYYGHILRVYEPESLKNSKNEIIEVYVPKYLCFISQNYFCLSFKGILEEIYQNSLINDKKCYKTENILNYVLFRMFLPKSLTTHISFPLGLKNYVFVDSRLRTEISIKLLFTVFSIKDLVLIFLSLMMESKIIIRHSGK